ncbi:MAG: BTAD domain-containing putative transcriptional regulator [Burkholderiales bacterium]
MSEAWLLESFGTPCLQHEHRADRRLALTRKDAGLLGFIALNPEAPSTRVAALLWPEAGERGALNNLRQRIHRLRRASGARLVEVGSVAALADDLRAVGPPSVAALDADLTAWDAELLGAHQFDDTEEFAAWLGAERRSWAERRIDALAKLASRAEAGQQLARAIQCAQQLASHAPLSEHAHRRLMRLHYLRGDPAAAVAAFEHCERVLKNELGLKPSAETLELLRSVERGLPPAQVVVLASVSMQPLPVGLIRPPRTIGRESQRERLNQAMRDGGIAVLVGEAGIGKTRLLLDFVASVEADSVAYAQARPGDAGVPFGAMLRLSRVLRVGSPDAADVMPLSMPARHIESTLHMAFQRGVTTLALDDLHFADRASVELLCALVDHDSLRGLRWLFAHRPPDAADDDAALLRTLADSSRAHWITVPPLAESDLVELVETLGSNEADGGRLAAALWRRTGGNPLYVLETLRAVRGVPTADAVDLPRPSNIAHMIDRRLLRLSERALALGRVAALAGPDFSPELAEQALATPALVLAGAWAELESADVLRGNAFAHDLVRDGMLRATPTAIAVHAHRLIAQHLEARQAEPGRIAPHWLAAQALRPAALAFRAAAARAGLAGRPREEAQLLLQAAAAFDANGDPNAAVECRALAIPPTVRSDGLTTALEASEALVAQHGEGVNSGLVYAMRALALVWAGRAVEAEAAGRQALARLALTDEALRMEASRTVAMACGLSGNPVLGLELMRPWMNRLDDLGDLTQNIMTCGAYTHLLLQGDRPGEALEIALRHRAFAAEAGDSLEELTALINASSAAVRRGGLARAIECGRAASALAPGDEQSRTLVGLNDAVLGYTLCGAGEYREGLALIGPVARGCDSALARLTLSGDGRGAPGRCAAATGATDKGATTRGGRSSTAAQPPTGQPAARARIDLGARCEPRWLAETGGPVCQRRSRHDGTPVGAARAG